MIVLAIIALIAGGVGTAVFSQYKKAQVKIARQRVMAVKNGVSQYMIDNNGCPKGIDDLIAQKYLDRGNAKDPWGKDFTFRCPGTNDPDNADISSAGPRQARRHPGRHPFLGAVAGRGLNVMRDRRTARLHLDRGDGRAVDRRPSSRPSG